jgi:hypothetical protein
MVSPTTLCSSYRNLNFLLKYSNIITAVPYTEKLLTIICDCAIAKAVCRWPFTTEFLDRAIVLVSFVVEISEVIPTPSDMTVCDGDCTNISTVFDLGLIITSIFDRPICFSDIMLAQPSYGYLLYIQMIVLV